VKSTDSGLNEALTTVDSAEFEAEFGAFETLALPAKNKPTPRTRIAREITAVRACMTSK